MGFWDELGGKVQKGMEDFSSDIEKERERAANMSDERLIREFKNSSNMKKRWYMVRN